MALLYLQSGKAGLTQSREMRMEVGWQTRPKPRMVNLLNPNLDIASTTRKTLAPNEADFEKL